MFPIRGFWHSVLLEKDQGGRRLHRFLVLQGKGRPFIGRILKERGGCPIGSPKANEMSQGWQVFFLKTKNGPAVKCEGSF